MTRRTCVRRTGPTGRWSGVLSPRTERDYRQAVERWRIGPLRSKDVGSSSNGCDERFVSVAPSDVVADAQFPHDDLHDLAFPGRGANVDGVDDD